MSNVTLRIGGRDYAVACADGEESHITGLGRMMQTKLDDMGGAGTQSEARTLLFAALLLADEVHELRGRPDANTPPARDAARDTAIDDVLVSVARRLENCASLLERRPVTS